MPELPEVESAVVRLRDAVVGKTIERVELFHPALRRRVSPKQLRSMHDARIERVERRGKHQLMILGDARTLHAHFRMTGDWIIGRTDEDRPRYARASIDFTDGSRVVLEDPRMLSTLDLHPAGAELDLGLGPEPSDPVLTTAYLHRALSRKRGPIKPVLLDQSIIAGLGNIYAAESLWHSKISPARSAASLTLSEVSSLLDSIRLVIEQATGARYTDADVSDLAVYDRVGLPCRRCGTPIERIAQAGRSTYFCPFCQRDASTAKETKSSRSGTRVKVLKKSSSAKRVAKAKRTQTKQTNKRAKAPSATRTAKKSSRAKRGRSVKRKA